MNFEKIKMVKVLEFILLCSFKSMIRSKELLHIDTPDSPTVTYSSFLSFEFLVFLLSSHITVAVTAAITVIIAAAFFKTHSNSEAVYATYSIAAM